MSIRIKQLGRIANGVIEAFLQAGTLPTVRAVIAGIATQLGGRTTGIPQLNYTAVQPDTVTVPAQLTTATLQAQNDIQVLYDEHIDLVNRIVRDADYKTTRRARLTQRMEVISTHVQAAQAKSLSSYPIDLTSFAGIDQQSTAFANFLDYTIELPVASNAESRASLAQGIVTWTASGTVLTQTGTPQAILSNLLNEAFFVRLAATAPATLTMTVTLPAPVSLSKVVLVGHCGSAAQAIITLDGTALISQTFPSTQRLNWEIAPQTVQTITITLIKTAPDGSANGQATFDFGLKSLNLLTETYLPSARFQSVPIHFAAPISSVTLHADVQTPANCGVSWSISRTGTGGTFAPIVPDVPLPISPVVIHDSKRIFPARTVRDLITAVTTVNDTATTSVDATLGVLATVRGSRTPLFTLCRVDPMATAVAIRRGRNAWRVSSYHYDVLVAGTVSNPQPGLVDFIAPRGGNAAQIFTRYQPTEFDLNNQYSGLSASLLSALRLPALEYPIRNQNDRVIHLFEATLTVNPGLAPSVLQTLSALSVSLPPIFANGQATFYCNGQKLQITANSMAGALAYTALVPLAPGDNLLQLVTTEYATLTGAAFDIGTALFSTLCSYNGQILWYADPGPMTAVSLFELQYQTARNDFSRFALAQDTTTNKNVVVLRELPTTVYDLVSQGTDTTEQVTSLIVRADLHGSVVQTSVTPKINSCSLEVSF